MSEPLDPIPWLVVLSLAWPVLAFMLGPNRGARLAIAGLSAQLVLVLALAAEISASGPRRHAVGGWGAPLGIDLLADGLGVAMLLVTAVVALPVAVYARSYFAVRPAGQAYFWPLCGLLVAALNVLFLSADLFNLYVGLELLGLSAVGLTAATAARAALRYLFTSLLGSGAFLAGVALVYGAYGTVSLELLAARVQALPAVLVAAGLMATGLAFKTALFPLHFWLPPAHGGAATPVSALLSALVLKASFYVLLRLWFGLFAPLDLVPAAQLLGMLGAAAILWGSAMALVQRHLKLVVAYSSVAQVGYLFLVFPLGSGAAPEVAVAAWQGGFLHLAAHALAKAAMFTAVGVMIACTMRDEVAGLGGVGAHLPLTVFAFGLAGMTLMGLPPSGGFSAKWLMLNAALGGGQWWWAAVMIAGGFFTAAWVFRVLRHAFRPRPAECTLTRPPRVLEASAFILAAAGLALGLFGSLPLALLGAGNPWPALAP